MRHHLFYRRHFKPAVRRALPHKAALRFHDLRHTCAGLLIAQGAHPNLIQARLGHSSIQITLARYGHLFPSVEAALADKLDAAFAAADAAPARDNVAALRPHSRARFESSRRSAGT
jgi:integrase